MGGSGRGPKEGDTPVEEDFPQRLADDQFYRALASVHRRRVLYYLLEANDSTVEELATVLCGWETTTKTMRSPTERTTLLVGLYHNHLPRLADAGLIEYEYQIGSVELGALHPWVTELIRQSVMVEQFDE